MAHVVVSTQTPLGYYVGRTHVSISSPAVSQSVSLPNQPIPLAGKYLVEPGLGGSVVVYVSRETFLADGLSCILYDRKTRLKVSEQLTVGGSVVFSGIDPTRSYFVVVLDKGIQPLYNGELIDLPEVLSV